MSSPRMLMNSYKDYLKGKRQSLLGVERTKLFDQGKISTRDILDNKGDPRTLKELKDFIDKS